MNIIFTVNYFLVEMMSCPVDSETFLMTEFINLKISRLGLSNVLIEVRYTYVFIEISDRTYIRICIYIVFLWKKLATLTPDLRIKIFGIPSPRCLRALPPILPMAPPKFTAIR
jgi:hypothetical protein